MEPNNSTTNKENYFVKLFNVNVNDKVEVKGGLSYLSWAFAWAEVKKMYPNTTYVIYERDTEYGPVNYFTDGRSCWVKTGVIVNGIEHIEELPVMDARNRSLPLSAVTSFDVNKAIQRSLTKALARHGLGLYIYAGDDLPEQDKQAAMQGSEAQESPKMTNAPQSADPVNAGPAQKPAKQLRTEPKVEKSSISPAASKKPLETLKHEIGVMAKKMMEINKGLKEYKAIVKEVVGDEGFKCNAATEAQYDLVLAIHDRLIDEGYGG